MAGFWTGLVHGTLLCSATLAVASLALPRDGDVADESPAPAATVPMRQPDTRTPAVIPDAPNAPDAAAGGVAEGATAEAPAPEPVEQLPDPVGSDFRRGSDDPPLAPLQSPAPVERHVPRSVAVEGEVTPPVTPDAGDMPPPVSTPPMAPGPLTPEPFTPEPMVAPGTEPPVVLAAPGRVAAPGPDPIPAAGQRPAATEPSPAAADPPPSRRGGATAARQPDAAGSDAARAPRPAPDLTIPRALFPAGTIRTAPSLPQPADATPPAPDLSDLKPGASR